MPDSTPTIVPRYKDWSVRWTKFMANALPQAEDLCLDWETLNCISWVCDGIEAITGHDYYAPYRDVTSVLEAIKAIREGGFQSLDQIIGSQLPEIPIGLAQSGDLVLVDSEWEVSDEIKRFMPHATALADPPLYWCVTPLGLAKGMLYSDGVKAFAVGRGVN